MGDLKDKRPGKHDGMSADDLVRSADMPGIPGRTTRVFGPPNAKTGDKWTDEGARCDAPLDDPGKDMLLVPGCLWTPRQRDHVMTRLGEFVSNAKGNFTDALQQIAFAELLKRDDEAGWAISFLIEVAGAHLLGRAIAALKTMREGSIAVLDGISDARGYAARAQNMLTSISEKSIEDAIKPAFKVATRAARKDAGKATPSGRVARDQKSAVLGFVAEMGTRSDERFLGALDTWRASADDVQLMVLLEGMAPRHHTVQAYVEAIEAKIKRFLDSKVGEIGRKPIAGRPTGTGGQQSRDIVDMHQDRRVVWVRDIFDATTLRFQTSTGEYDNAASWASASDAGLVPAEFQDAAIARTEQQWGAVETVDDPYLAHAKRGGYDIDKLRASLRAGMLPGKLSTSSTSTKPLPRLDLGPVMDPGDRLPQPDPMAPFKNVNLAAKGPP